MSDSFKKGKLKSFFFVSIAFIALSSCTCGTPFHVTPVQKSDKKLSCKQILVEITEAEQHRSYAKKQRGITIGEALTPVCWATGFVDGSKAVNKANSRIEYLTRIYDARSCDDEGKPPARPRPPRAARPPAPQFMPMPQQSAPIIVNVPPQQPQYIPQPQPQFVPQYRQPYIMQEPSSDSSYYQAKQYSGKSQMHEHVDSEGKSYIHSHPHDGPHKHLEDK